MRKGIAILPQNSRGYRIPTVTKNRGRDYHSSMITAVGLGVVEIDCDLCHETLARASEEIAGDPIIVHGVQQEHDLFRHPWVLRRRPALR